MDNIIDFPKLMNAPTITLFLETTTPYAKGRFIAEYISKIMFIKGDKLYILNKYKAYEAYTDIESKILNIITKLYDESESTLSGIKRLEITKKHPGLIHKYNSNNAIKQFLPQLRARIANENIVLNLTIGELHFENGFLDTKTGKFAQRTDKHFITKYIPREYKKSTEKERNIVLNEFNKIYPNKEDRDLVLGNISISLSWKAPLNQTSLFLIGHGSAGKSFVMETLMNVLGPYVQKLKSDVLSGSETNMNKVLNTLQDEIQTLIIWINEMKDQKMDSSVYKDLCDGNIQTVRLFKDGNNGFKHNAYVVATSQNMPNITMDTGTSRRIVGYTHTSRFSDGTGTDDNPQIDEENHIYLKNINLHAKLEPYCNAVIDIFVKYCMAWCENNKIYDVSKSENFQTSTALITETNNYMQDFIDSRLEIVGDKNDKLNKISKDRMKELYLKMYPERHIAPQQLLQALKSRNIAYDKDERCFNVRGSYMGVKERKITSVEFVDEVDELSGEPLKDENQIKLEQQAKQIQELLLKLKELEDDNTKLKSVVKMKTILEREPDILIEVVKEVCATTDYLSTADDEPEPEPEVFIQPKKKLQKKKEKTPSKKISKSKEEEIAFAKSFTGEEDESPEIEDKCDEGHIMIW
jgi:phage/plasmid-associated DNA primase